MHGAPLDVGQGHSTVDGVAKHVEHARKNRFADRRLERPAGVLYLHSASKTLGRGQRNSAHVMRVLLCQHLDYDAPLISRV
jgi:ABC-type uncharacterized transport system YnjBCD ATPase subunit